MRVVFMGTAELACPCLEAVVATPGMLVVGVITQPDRPKGRSLKIQAPPVKMAAEQLGLPVAQPETIRDPDAIAALRAWAPDVIVIVAYGQFLPAAILAMPPRGCVNVHASLLPRWRGAAPIQYAILHGDVQTGVSTMVLNERMDTGDVILQRTEPILAGDTTGSLYPRLSKLGAAIISETLTLIASGTAPRHSQAESLATYARKITKEQGRIDWRCPANAIERQIRAFDPQPGAFTEIDGMLLKVWRANVRPEVSGPPGTMQHGNVIATGQGGLELLEVQPAGGKRMPFAAFLRGHPVAVGIQW